MDDFVMTISDDERSIPELDDIELEAENAQPKVSQNSRKRKIHNEEGSNGANGVNGTNKRAKKLGKGTLNAKFEVEEPDLDISDDGGGEDDGAMNPDFDFQLGDVEIRLEDDFDGWGLGNGDSKSMPRGDKKGVDLDEIIARRRSKGKRQLQNGVTEPEDATEKSKMVAGEDEGSENLALEDDEELLADDVFGMGATNEDEEDEASSEIQSDHDSPETSNEEESDRESAASPVSHPEDMGSDSEQEKEDPKEVARRREFFAPEDPADINGKAMKSSISTSFQNLSLSRPVLKGLAAVGFSTPTPIQSKTIPVALLGKDVVGGAVTGSGKTAAFLVPILERLLYRPKKVPTSRVAILMPTRELAVQCHNVAVKLASFTDISFCRLVGGFSLREQETELRKRPDVIIATPGRFIDHMRNSASFTVDTLEILILDEADRMLEDGFADELNEILTNIPTSRQTMLFSATMTDSVDKLIRVGMSRPVRLMVDARKQTVGTLVQEFVRLRPGREDKRLAYLMALCSILYTDRVIVFFRQKKEAHRVRVIFGLCGLKAAELHGNMSQEQRINSVESFRSARVSFLLATDLASRGLDIKGVETVVNYEAPQSHEIYLHRVGRTARAGRSGRACTIAAEPDRKVVKSAVKSARAQGAKIVSRVIEAEVADEWVKKLQSLEDEVEEVLKEEKEEKILSQGEMQVRRGENIIEHEEEIMSRPRRTWFESERDKKLSKKIGMVDLNGPAAGEKKGKKKLSNKDKKRLDDRDARKEGNIWKKGKEERAGSRAVKSSKHKAKKNPTKPVHKSKGRKR